MRYFFAFIFSCLLPLASLGRTVMDRINQNLGNVGLDGVPKITFSPGRPPVAAALGISLRIAHRITCHTDGTARSSWNIAGLRTCVWTDRLGNLTWAKPDGRNITFAKTPEGFASVRHNAILNAADEDGRVHILDEHGWTWSYQDGFLQKVSRARAGEFVFTTDRESITGITNIGRDGQGQIVLLVEYSETGELQKLIFPAEKQQSEFHWSADHCLMAVVDAGGKRTDFSYKNGLLAGWTSDKNSSILKWASRANPAQAAALGRPSVYLAEDSSFKYEHARFDRTNILRVFTTNGEFVSETRSSSRGIAQRTPQGEIKGIYKRNSAGIVILEAVK